MDDVQYKYKPFNIEYEPDGSSNQNQLWIENPNDDPSRTTAERVKLIAEQKEKDYAAKKVWSKPFGYFLTSLLLL